VQWRNHAVSVVRVESRGKKIMGRKFNGPNNAHIIVPNKDDAENNDK
jgi:hypothetical protein